MLTLSSPNTATAAFAEAVLNGLHAELERHARSGIIMQTESHNSPMVSSRLGGDPDLPTGLLPHATPGAGDALSFVVQPHDVELNPLAVDQRLPLQRVHRGSMPKR